MYPNTVNILGITGRAGSGKSTIAKWCRDNLKAQIISIAGPLKLILGDVFGFAPSQLYGSQAEKEAPDPRYPLIPREYAQSLGSAIRKHLGEDSWIDKALRTAAGSQASLVVFDDVRYLNEAAKIKAYGGATIKLVCPDSKSKADPNHESEAGVDTIPSNLLRATIDARLSDGSTVLVDAFKRLLEPGGTLRYLTWHTRPQVE